MTIVGLVIDWRRPADTVTALDSLAAGVVRPDLLICVENGCTPEGVDFVRKHAPSGTLIRVLDTNLGFAEATNIGVEDAIAYGADWVLMLNNDAVVEPRCLEVCLDSISASGANVAVAGPAVVFMDRPDVLWYAGGTVSRRFVYTRHVGLGRPATEIDGSSETEYVAACCALVSTRAWAEVGGFRADYFAYYEDTEWCVRARELGWRCWFVGEVLARHAVSSSSGQAGSLGLTRITAYYLARNPLRFALETSSQALRAQRVVGALIVWGGYNALRIVQSRSRDVLRAYIQGVSDAFKGRMGKWQN